MSMRECVRAVAVVKLKACPSVGGVWGGMPGGPEGPRVGEVSVLLASLAFLLVVCHHSLMVIKSTCLSSEWFMYGGCYHFWWVGESVAHLSLPCPVGNHGAYLLVV